MKMKDATIYSSDNNSSITFYSHKKRLLYDYDEYERFIKGCEHAVRKDPRYTAFISDVRGKRV